MSQGWPPPQSRPPSIPPLGFPPVQTANGGQNHTPRDGPASYSPRDNVSKRMFSAGSCSGGQSTRTPIGSPRSAVSYASSPQVSSSLSSDQDDGALRSSMRRGTYFGMYSKSNEGELVNTSQRLSMRSRNNLSRPTDEDEEEDSQLPTPEPASRLERLVIRVGLRLYYRMSMITPIVEHLEEGGFASLASMQHLTDEAAWKLSIPPNFAAALREEARGPPEWQKRQQQKHHSDGAPPPSAGRCSRKRGSYFGAFTADSSGQMVAVARSLSMRTRNRGGGERSESPAGGSDIDRPCMQRMVSLPSDIGVTMLTHGTCEVLRSRSGSPTRSAMEMSQEKRAQLLKLASSYSSAGPGQTSIMERTAFRVGMKLGFRISEVFQIAGRLEESGFASRASFQHLTDEVAESLGVPQRFADALRQEGDRSPDIRNLGDSPGLSPKGRSSAKRGSHFGLYTRDEHGHLTGGAKALSQRKRSVSPPSRRPSPPRYDDEKLAREAEREKNRSPGMGPQVTRLAHISAGYPSYEQNGKSLRICHTMNGFPTQLRNYLPSAPASAKHSKKATTGPWQGLAQAVGNFHGPVDQHEKHALEVFQRRQSVAHQHHQEELAIQKELMTGHDHAYHPHRRRASTFGAGPSHMGPEVMLSGKEATVFGLTPHCEPPPELPHHGHHHGHQHAAPHHSPYSSRRPSSGNGSVVPAMASPPPGRVALLREARGLTPRGACSHAAAMGGAVGAYSQEPESDGCPSETTSIPACSAAAAPRGLTPAPDASPAPAAGAGEALQ